MAKKLRAASFGSNEREPSLPPKLSLFPKPLALVCPTLALASPTLVLAFPTLAPLAFPALVLLACLVVWMMLACIRHLFALSSVLIVVLTLASPPRPLPQSIIAAWYQPQVCPGRNESSSRIVTPRIC